MTISHRTMRSRVSLAMSVLVAASLACSFFAPAPTMTPQPTNTPAPSPTPLPAVPPAVIDRLPEPGAEQAPAAPVVVYFDAPMDRSSAEGAFKLIADDGSPIDGSFTWSDNDSTLTFTPVEPLAHSQHYQAQVAAGVRNRAGLELNSDFGFDFQTLPDLAVLQVYPAPESAEAAADSVISVAFNRPIVPLTAVADQADLINPLAFSPEVPGTGEWVTTSLYRFRPERPLIGGQTYTASIAAGLEDTVNTVLASDYTWSFTIALPTIVSTTPAFDAFDVPLGTTITTTFNQPMDHASTEAAFALSGPNGLVPGSLKWSDDSRSLGFTPNARLDFGTTYQITFADGARAAGSDGPAMEPTSSSFTTVLPARLDSVDPGDGGIDVDPYGAVVLYFNSPMDVATLDRNVSIEPKATLAYTYWNEVDFTYAMSFDLMPGTTYTLALEPGMLDPYGQPAFTDRQTLTFTVGDYPPQAQLGANGLAGYYRGNGPTAATLTTRNVDSVSFNLAAVDAPTFLVFANGSGTTTTPLSISRSWTVRPEGARNERIVTPVPLSEQGTLAPGLYVLQAYPDGGLSEMDQAVVVSNIQLTMKAGLHSGMAWAIDIRTGEPVADLPITLWRTDGSRLDSANTGADGTASFAWDEEIPTYYELVAISDDPQRMAAASSGWSNGLEAWAFNVEQRYEETPLVTYITTDRPLYRPNDTAEIKGIVRARSDARYTVPELGSVFVNVYGPMGEVVVSDTVKLSDYGTFAMSAPIADGADLGMYNIVVRRVGSTENDPALGTAYFNVAEYRKPEFNVTVTPDSADVVVNDTVSATIDARFFFDLPVTGAMVSWQVYATPTFVGRDVSGNYSFTDPDYGLEPQTSTGLGLIAQGITTTDAQGRASLSFTAPPADPGRTVSYDIQATVTDPAGDVQVTGHAGVTAHPSQLSVGVSASSYIVSANEAVSFNVLSVDNAGEIVSNQVVQASLERVDWSCVQIVDPISRQNNWTCDETRTPSGSQRLTTDARGRATGSLTPDQAGSYRLIASVTDAAGREARAVAYVYAIGEGEIAWRQDPKARLELTTDRRTYSPGDTAEVLIPSPLGAGAVALISIERDGVLRHEVITLDGAATTYRLPLTADDAPGVFVSAVVVRPGEQPDYRVGLTRILVDPKQQLLTVTATPDRDNARPGEIVRYTVDVRDATGAPVQAEVEVGIADLAALKLSDPNSVPIDQAFYGPPPLGVRTGLSLNVSGDLIPDDSWALGRGGGGGGGEGVADLATPRSRFKDTAYWSAQGVTDENGTFTFDVTLPDNLTTWRLTARAVTTDTRVGATQQDLVASKSLQIRPITPRFFTAGDTVTLKAVVDNGGADALDVKVLLTAKGVTMSGDAEQTAGVPAGGRVEIAWPVTVGDGDAADLTFSVQGGGLFDASKPTLGQGDAQLIPIYRYVAPEVVATSGDLEGAGIRVEGIGVPRRFGAVAADLDVSVTPSLMASFAPALNALEDPDQPDREIAAGWATRLIANAAVLRALRAADTQADLQSVLLGRIQRAVRALNSLQAGDGGWGYWVDGPSDERLTDLIVIALTTDRQLEGEAVQGQIEYTLQRAVEYLSSLAYNTFPGDVPADENWRIDQLALTTYALTTANSDVGVIVDTLYDSRDRLSAEGLALLALSMPEGDPRARTIVDTLTSTADVSATGASWPSKEESSWWWAGSQTRSTSLVLAALLRHDPENPLAPNVVRWLMIARRADSWETTEETAWALTALSGWAEHTGELKGDFDYTVRLNDNLLLQGSVDPSGVADAASAHTADLIRAQANQLAFERSAGDGRLYYTASLNVVLPAGQAPAVDRGLVISRSYALESTECGGADQPLCPPITSARVGDTLRVTVNVSTASERHFVVLEDLFPAGAEPIDTSLLTAPRTDEPIGLRTVQPDFWWGGWWFGHQSVRDDRVRVVAETLPAGSYTYSYLLYLQTDGVFQVRPAQAYELYAPEVFGRSEGGVFTVDR